MKKILKSLLCCLLCVVMVGIPAMAESGPMNITWEGDYSNPSAPKLIISFTSPALYTQQVTAVMYPANVETPTIADYCRMAEVTAAPGKKTTVTFGIGNDLSLNSGVYSFKLQGNGHLAEQCKDTVTFTIYTPSQASSLLTRINAETTALGMAGIIGEAKDKLQLEVTGDPVLLEKLANTVIAIRKADHGNAFASLQKFKETFVMSDIIVYLKETTATAAGLQEKVENNATLLGIDITDADYIATDDGIYNKVIANKNTYGGTGINSCAQLVKAVNELKAIEMVNATEGQKLSAAISKYYTVFGIPVDSYNKYISYSDSEQQKVIRQIYSKNFSDIVSVKNAFINGVKSVVNSDSEGGSSGPVTQGPGASNGAIGIGGATGGSVAPAPTTTVQGTFKDLGASHWAYKFVNDLQKSSIIAGYADGTFKPSNNVTREEFVKMIVSATGLYDKDADCDFKDISKDYWAYKFIASAKKSELVSGTSQESFGAGSRITREDVCVIVSRVIDKFKQSDSTSAQNIKTEFNDDENISEYAKASVQTLVVNKVINGFEGGNFEPKSPLTRAQAAKVISLLRDLIG